MNNRLTIHHAIESCARLTAIPLHGRDYIMVATDAPCPSCHGDGQHKTAVPSRCGVCCGSGRAYGRKALTDLGRQLMESGL